MMFRSQLRSFFSLTFAVIMTFFSLSSLAHTETGEEKRWDRDWAALTSAEIVENPNYRPDAPTTSAIKIDPSFIEQKLKIFSGAEATEIEGNRTTILERGSAQGRKDARAYLKQEYEKLGYLVSEFTYGSGKNFIAEKPGTRNRNTLIISSHLDSVGNAGANDDGIGTIAALTIAQALSKMKLKHTLKFMAFDQEEYGLVGSKAYVQSLSKNEAREIMGVIQIEMMGVNKRKDGVFHAIDCNKQDSRFLTRALQSAIDEGSIGIKIGKACTQASDHASFWAAKIPAIVLSENFFGGDADPCYHRNCDRFDSRLDFGYAARITEAAANAVAVLAE